MNYIDSVTDFFRSPKWMPNLLLGGLCMLIPVVGPIVLVGWHSAAHFSRGGQLDYATYPEFNFDQFGKNLERGVWPFLIQLVCSIVMVPVAWVLMIVPMMLGAGIFGSMAEQQHSEPPVGIMAGFGIVMFLAYLLFFGAYMLLVKPLMIRAVLTQDFAAAFNFRFVLDFTKRTWPEQIVSVLFLMFAGMALMMAGALVFCVGMYAAIALVMFSNWHLDRQLYVLYLQRGGEIVPLSPKLSSTPPPLA